MTDVLDQVGSVTVRTDWPQPHAVCQLSSDQSERLLCEADPIGYVVAVRLMVPGEAVGVPMRRTGT